MSGEFEKPRNEADKLLSQVFDDDAATRLRFMAVADPNRRLNLFLSGVITAEEAGEGCSYSSDGTPRVTEERLRDAGAMIFYFPENDDSDQA